MMCLFLFEVVYLSAFVSMFMEISQLIGTDGLLPAKVTTINFMTTHI